VEVRYVAITACPTGIAHTYMAAEKLQMAASEGGHEIKVETQGSIGAENVLTAADIAAADAVIIAADKNVELDRFAGKRVLTVGVADGVHKPAELLDRAINAPVQQGTAPVATDEKGGLVATLYKALMGGVSPMIPFVVVGWPPHRRQPFPRRIPGPLRWPGRARGQLLVEDAANRHHRLPDDDPDPGRLHRDVDRRPARSGPRNDHRHCGQHRNAVRLAGRFGIPRGDSGLELTATDRDAAIAELVGIAARTGKVDDPAAVVASALAREATVSTGLGDGIAIPHAKTDAVSEPVVVYARSREGIDWSSRDGKPATELFLIAVPEQAAGDAHLTILGALSRKLVNPQFRAELSAAGPDRAYELLTTVQ
jgi:fructose-specific phosphotransferase system IIB component/fructose-specific phosphotransferase system IIA component